MNVALGMVLAGAVLAGPAAGERTVRIDKGTDPRLGELAQLLTAELADAGFTVVAAPATATVTLRMNADRAFVAAYVADVDPTFVAETSAAERAAVEVTEWLIAVWPPPRPAPPPAVAPPPPAPVPAVVAASPPAPPAGRARELVLDVGFSTLWQTDFGARYGAEAGVAVRWPSLRVNLTPFARLALGFPWFGATYHFTYDELAVHYATVALTAGFERPLNNQFSIEAAASAGVALMAYDFETTAVAVVSTPTEPATYGSGHHWLPTLGGEVGIVINRLVGALALVVEGRATWMLNQPTFVGDFTIIRIGPSSVPAIGLVVAMRAGF